MTMKVKITDEMRDARWNCSNMDGDNLFHALIPLIAKQVMEADGKLMHEPRLWYSLAGHQSRSHQLEAAILSQSIEIE